MEQNKSIISEDLTEFSVLMLINEILMIGSETSVQKISIVDYTSSSYGWLRRS
jgi:hypothetical protein